MRLPKVKPPKGWNELAWELAVVVVELLGLSRPIPLDPGVRFQLLHALDLLRGRVAIMDQVSGQMIDKMRGLHLTPATASVEQQVQGFQTARFCRARHLPLRPVQAVIAARIG